MWNNWRFPCFERSWKVALLGCKKKQFPLLLSWSLICQTNKHGYWSKTWAPKWMISLLNLTKPVLCMAPIEIIMLICLLDGWKKNFNLPIHQSDSPWKKITIQFDRWKRQIRSAILEITTAHLGVGFNNSWKHWSQWLYLLFPYKKYEHSTWIETMDPQSSSASRKTLQRLLLMAEILHHLWCMKPPKTME